tara:strand:+ start:102 stop:758 length:657 start_codon:yes stop_codon:yes gene_type:complete
MKKLISILFIVSSFAFSQGYDFQQLCLDCAAQNGFYCGDDPANWTQYSPNGCVPNGAGGLEYLNDGWDDCVNGADEDDAVPTSPDECAPPMEECDTIFVEIPLIQYEYIYQIDTITEIEVVIQTETEYIYVTDTVYADVLDTMFIDVIEYVEIFVIDTIVQIETEYLDCETGMPCNSGMQEIINKSTSTGLMYNLQGQAIRKPEGIYIEEGKVKYKIN